MKTSHWHTGRSLAITMAISYTVCALLYRLWPEQGVAFLNALFHGLLDRGVYIAPALYEAGFVSAAHTAQDIADTVAAAREVFKALPH